MNVNHFFFLNDTATTEIYTLSLHDALPICPAAAPPRPPAWSWAVGESWRVEPRSEEHTSELQSPYDLVCRLLLEKKKTKSSWLISCLTLKGQDVPCIVKFAPAIIRKCIEAS